MIRRALIIYCDDTPSDPLEGALADYENYIDFLQSNLGGDWRASEIYPLRNPTIKQVTNVVSSHFIDADYSFIVFSGHGYINSETMIQYLEVSNGDIPIHFLRTSAKRQTLIIDACRGFLTFSTEITKSFSESSSFIGKIASTRELFDQAVLNSEIGWSIMYSASENESAAETSHGGAYLISLLKIAEIWEVDDTRNMILPLNVVHQYASSYISKHFRTIQKPFMEMERRRQYFPFAVKFINING